MKLCLLANATCIHTRRWAAHFSARGHEVVVLSLSAGEIPDVRVECVGPDPRKLGRVAYLLAVPAVRRAIRELKPDIVHAHYAGGYGLVGALTGFHPLVTSAWGSDVLLAPQSGLLMKWIIRMCVDRADLITSVADHMSDSMRALGISGRILTLTYGADRGVFRPRPENSWSSTGLIVSTRHLEPVYNLELLVEALPAVFAAAPSAKVVIIGEGGGTQATRVEGTRARSGRPSPVCGQAEGHGDRRIPFKGRCLRVDLAVGWQQYQPSRSHGLRSVSCSHRHPSEPRVDTGRPKWLSGRY